MNLLFKISYGLYVLTSESGGVQYLYKSTRFGKPML